MYKKIFDNGDWVVVDEDENPICNIGNAEDEQTADLIADLIVSSLNKVNLLNVRDHLNDSLRELAEIDASIESVEASRAMDLHDVPRDIKDDLKALETYLAEMPDHLKDAESRLSEWQNAVRESYAENLQELGWLRDDVVNNIVHWAGETGQEKTRTKKKTGMAKIYS